MSSAGTLYAGKATTVVPSDLETVENIFDALYVGVGGDISLVLLKNDFAAPVLIANVQAGSILPFRTKHILDTATTATNIVGLTLTA